MSGNKCDVVVDKHVKNVKRSVFDMLEFVLQMLS